jgi:hypothetical protein
MHADRTNRIMLILLGLALTAAGVAGALAGFGGFGEATKHDILIAGQLSDYFGRHGDWLWPVIAVAARPAAPRCRLLP